VTAEGAVPVRDAAAALKAAAPKGPARTLTVLVHGTFAAHLRWWRPGDGATTTFADRLERALERRGIAGTVWKPALAAGFGCEDFSWSGRNRHEDRVAGGRRLAIQLNALAETLGATDTDPLVANLLGHSHGGSVVLEALPRLSPSVRVGQVVLLGTPLLSYRPTLRIVRLALALLLLFVVVSLAVFVLGTFIVPGVFDWMCALVGICAMHTKVGAGWLLLLAAAMVMAYGWIFMLVAWLVDVVWRVLLFPLTALSKKHPGQVYGPAPHRLAAILGGRRAVLFTSHQDEADLILELSMAPRRVYAEWVASKWGAEVKVLERIALRPVVVGLLLRILEIVLERYMLGFSWLRVLIYDHEMADLDRGAEYPNTVIERVDVSEELREALYRQPASVPVWWPLPVPGAEKLGGDARRVLTLKESLRVMVRDVLTQVKPRHSEYYESGAVLEKVADVIAGLT
jgi:hypothetical protein